MWGAPNADAGMSAATVAYPLAFRSAFTTSHHSIAALLDTCSPKITGGRCAWISL